MQNDADHIREVLIRQIEKGELRAGDRLPAERELVKTLGVSRNALRDALSVLAASGLVQRHVGRGTFVTGAVPQEIKKAASSLITGTSPSDLMDARLVIEPQLAILVARNGTDEDLERLRQCVQSSARAQTFGEFELWDAKFHYLIGEATRNSFIVRIFDMIDSIRSKAEWAALKKRSLTVERQQRYQSEHEQIVQALSDRDAGKARELMHKHLLAVRDNLLDHDFYD